MHCALEEALEEPEKKDITRWQLMWVRFCFFTIQKLTSSTTTSEPIQFREWGQSSPCRRRRRRRRV